MKKLSSVIMTLVCLFMVISCGEKPDSLDDLDEVPEFEAGWWKYSSTKELHDKYFYFDEDKNILRIGDDEKEFNGATLEYYQTNKIWSFEYLYNLAENNPNGISFTKIEETDLPDWAATDNTDDDTPTQQRENSYIILPILETANINETKTISFYAHGGLEAADVFEVKIIKNESNIEITANAYCGYFEICGKSEGSVTITVYDKTANCESSECEIQFIKDTTPNPNILILGKWYSGTKYYEFYDDNTGKWYFNDENNYGSFNWVITDNRLKLTGGAIFDSTFTVTADTLILDSYTFTINGIPYTEPSVTFTRVSQ